MSARKERWPTAVWIVRRRCKDGTTYRLKWQDRAGRWHSQACGRDYALARELRDQKRQELRDRATGVFPVTAPAEFRNLLDTLMAGKSPDTIRNAKAAIRLLEDTCHPTALEDIDRPTIMSFRAKRLEAKRSAATVNKELRHIKAALSYAVDAGLLRHNCLLRWKAATVREPERLIRVIEPAEFTKLIGATEFFEFQVLMIVAYRQGLRRRELCNLRWLGPHDEPLVDLEEGTLRVVNRPEEGELTKSRKNRTIPLHPEARTALATLWQGAPKIVADGCQKPKYPHVFTWPDGRPFAPDWVSHEFARVVKKAGIPRCTTHDLRRSFSTLAQRAGVDKYVVKDLGGWSAVSVVERHYTGDVAPVLKAAMDRIVAAG